MIEGLASGLDYDVDPGPLPLGNCKAKMDGDTSRCDIDDHIQDPGKHSLSVSYTPSPKIFLCVCVW
jgi:hypothetical protein